jgi:hypothetical protein
MVMHRQLQCQKLRIRFNKQLQLKPPAFFLDNSKVLDQKVDFDLKVNQDIYDSLEVLGEAMDALRALPFLRGFFS